MNTLVIYAHPGHDGHHAYFLEQLKIDLDKRKINFEVLDLYELRYDPILRLEELGSAKDLKVSEDTINYQNKITEAKNLIFIFPTWWQSAPAIMKGFFDRIFSAGFAFVYKNGLPVALLKGKKAAVFSASGAPRLFNKYLIGDRGLKIVTKNILNFCGVKAKAFAIGSARKLDEKKKEIIEKEVTKMTKYLFN